MDLCFSPAELPPGFSRAGSEGAGPGRTPAAVHLPRPHPGSAQRTRDGAPRVQPPQRVSPFRAAWFPPPRNGLKLPEVAQVPPPFCTSRSEKIISLLREISRHSCSRSQALELRHQSSGCAAVQRLVIRARAAPPRSLFLGVCCWHYCFQPRIRTVWNKTTKHSVKTALNAICEFRIYLKSCFLPKAAGCCYPESQEQSVGNPL